MLASAGFGDDPRLAHPLGEQDLSERVIDFVRPVWLSSPDNKIEMRVCDYAAYIVQKISGTSFGASPYTRSDEVVSKARTWVRENMEHEENGKTILSLPEALTRNMRE
jgi:hypothetical protein